jgi:CubicO group peptidase (beta-lactamase class C family)
MNAKTTVLTLLALSLPPAAAAQARTAADYMAAVEGATLPAGPNGLGGLTIAELMARFSVPGVSIAVIHDHQIHWAKGYGIADVATGALVDTGTMFQAASMSKPVAAMAVLRAVQDGLFTLDDDINRILTSWKLDGGELTREHPVTPRMLTSHTSGLGDGFGFPGYDPSDTVPTVVQILQGHRHSNVGVLFMERPPIVGK